jgi:hypothetical protein
MINCDNTGYLMTASTPGEDRWTDVGLKPGEEVNGISSYKFSKDFYLDMLILYFKLKNLRNTNYFVFVILGDCLNGMVIGQIKVNYGLQMPFKL